MKVQVFAKKYRLSKRDSVIVRKLYGDQDKSEKEWASELAGKVVLKEPKEAKAEPKKSASSEESKETPKEKVARIKKQRGDNDKNKN